MRRGAVVGMDLHDLSRSSCFWVCLWCGATRSGPVLPLDASMRVGPMSRARPRLVHRSRFETKYGGLESGGGHGLGWFLACSLAHDCPPPTSWGGNLLSMVTRLSVTTAPYGGGCRVEEKRRGLVVEGRTTGNGASPL